MMNRKILFLSVALFSLLCGFQVQRVLSDQTVMSSANINHWIVETIVHPYRMAYTTLNEDIVQPLLTVDTESDQPTLRKLIQLLLLAIEDVRDQLHKATKASEQIRINIDEQVTQLVLSIENQEEQIRQSQIAVIQANINVQSAQNQVNSAEGDLRDSQHALNDANQAVRDAQKAVDDARVCGLGRRRKRFLGKIAQQLNPVKIFRETVGKPLCSVINAGGIDSAKQRRGMAEQRVRETQQRLYNSQQELASKRAQYDTARAQLSAANTQLSTMKSVLNEQRTKQSLVASWTKKIQDVEVHLNSVLGSSIVLPNETAQLIDFELVIHPLNDIYEEMINNNVMEAFDFEISAETARQIKANLEKLIEKMPKMPLNGISTTDSEETHSDDIVDNETTDAPNTDSDEVHTTDTIDEEVTDAPNTDSDEFHTDDTVNEETTNTPNTESDEVHTEDIVDEEVTDAPDTDFDEVLTTVNFSEEVTDAPDTDSDEAHSDEIADTTVPYDDMLE
jgi:hypothetical protein